MEAIILLVNQGHIRPDLSCKRKRVTIRPNTWDYQFRIHQSSKLNKIQGLLYGGIGSWIQLWMLCK